MQVVGERERGTPEAFDIMRPSDPQIGPGKVRRRGHAAVNPADLVTRGLPDPGEPPFGIFESN